MLVEPLTTTAACAYTCALTRSVAVHQACLPEAAMMAQALRRNGIKARVLIMSGDGWSHAVTAYQYPPEKGQIWCWDSDEQSVPVSARWTSSEILADAWMRACQRQDDVLHARFE